MGGLVVSGRASRVKMVGMAEMGAPISLDGAAVHLDCGVSAYVIFILHQKIQKMAKCTFWHQLTQADPDKVHRAVKWLCVTSKHHKCHVVYWKGKRVFAGRSGPHQIQSSCPMWQLSHKKPT